MDPAHRPDRVAPSLRSALTRASELPEAQCLTALLELADSPEESKRRVADRALHLVRQIRSKRRSVTDQLMFEYSLSSDDGLALMRLAEAFLRIPDSATRGDLVRNKIVGRNWRAHLRRGQSLAVNGITIGLYLASRVLAGADGQNAGRKVLARASMPLIRSAVAFAMHRLGKHFVAGETIEAALRNIQRDETLGFRHSYDILGEAALTEDDAARYAAAYEAAIHSVGRHSQGRGIFDGPGISVKLSALHPRYSRSKIRRVREELLPRLKHLALLAKQYCIGFNIDAEEADRLEMSLDLIEALCLDPDLAGWDGIGFAVQTYQKRALQVIDWAIGLGRRSGRRLMLRLVKGAYWDMEIKRAQVEGLVEFPVFTRKVHTDVCYLACARKMLAAPDAIYPQFATHNAQTIATILESAGGDPHPHRFEFQCLYGMGKTIYEDLVSGGRSGVPCRVYAPVGAFDTLLPYLVRRLIENGANSSFVHRIADGSLNEESLIAHPADLAREVNPVGAPHERIALPADIYGSARRNSRGYDLSDEGDLVELENGIRDSANIAWTASPTHGAQSRPERPVVNPADHADIVGHVQNASAEDIQTALSVAEDEAPRWAATPAGERAACLARAADALQARMPLLVGLIVREAGKTRENAIGEVREAIDFLRYYSHEAVRTLDDDPNGALGPVVCISPWNFPLAIFVGQVAAALAAGNAVIAKPAEETPLTAAEAMRILLESGIPTGAVQLVTGDGDTGAALVADARIQGVIFTGSTAVAKLIQRQLADRLSRDGRPVPLVAETGGQNAIIIDSSALPEQSVADVIKSAFDSAGQRCSAARILCIQEEVAPTVLHMLRGAINEISTGDPHELATDVGPIISDRARVDIQNHISTMQARGFEIFAAPCPASIQCGNFIAPTLIEIERVSDLTHEVFGPVLHVVSYKREEFIDTIEAINATGYGLTFGIQSRLDRIIQDAANASSAGNIYVNRNIIGAVVGIQPFGGSGLSGTGPKAGGPLYLSRLRRQPPSHVLQLAGSRSSQLSEIAVYSSWLRSIGRSIEADECDKLTSEFPYDFSADFPGPAGERNRYHLETRGRIVAIASAESDVLVQFAVILATGNTMVIEEINPAQATLSRLPKAISRHIQIVRNWRTADDLGAILFAGSPAALLDLLREVAKRSGPILQVQSAYPERRDGARYDLGRLFEERLVCTNSAAAGGNASLMSI